MRVLLYLGTRPDQLCSVSEIARAYGVSQNHLMKVANDLVRQGHVTSVRGRFGGMRLGRPPGEINVGAVIRHTEEGFALADCDACVRSEEHTSELQSLMRISYAVFCLKKKKSITYSYNKSQNNTQLLHTSTQ